MLGSVHGFNPEYAEDAPTQEQVRGLSGNALLEFGTSWCGHCQAARPAVEAVLAARPDLLHIKIGDGRGRPLGRAFGVKQWPTLILLRDGEEVARLVRPTGADEVRELLAPAINSNPV